MINSDLKRFLNPEYNFSTADISLLKKEINNNPWFQLPYQLLAKASHQNQASDYKNHLNQAALYTINRENLFDYIYKTKVVNPPKVEKIAEPQKEKPVATEIKTTLKTETKVSIGPVKTSTGEEIKSKDDLRKIVREQLAKIEKERKTKEKKETEVKTTEPQKQAPAAVEIKAPVPTTKPDKQPDQKQKAQSKTPTTKSDNHPDQKPKANSQQPEAKSQKAIMEDFIKTEPSVNRPKDGPYDETLRLAKESLEDKMEFVSETLAEIYFKQDYPKKAIKIYEQLMLKVPEKKLYFAARIKEIVDNK